MGKRILFALGLVLVLSVLLLGGCVPADGGDTNTTIYMVGFLVLIFGVFYFLIIRPQRKRQQEQQECCSLQRLVMISLVRSSLASQLSPALTLQTTPSRVESTPIRICSGLASGWIRFSIATLILLQR